MKFILKSHKSWQIQEILAILSFDSSLYKVGPLTHFVVSTKNYMAKIRKTFYVCIQPQFYPFFESDASKQQRMRQQIKK